MNPFIFIIFTLLSIVALFCSSKKVSEAKTEGNLQENTNSLFSFLCRYEKIICAAVLIIGILVRISFFWDIPNGLNQDEASLAYDTYADVVYGQDRNGDHNPVYSVAWGSGQSALYNWASRIFIGLFGLNVLTARAANVLFGIVALFAFWGILKRITEKPNAIIGLFIFAICPWHIMMSRWGLDCNIFPNVFILALYFLLRGIENPKFYPLSLFVFGVSLYGYGAAYMTVPVFLILSAAYLLYHKKITWKITAVSAAVFAVVALPLAVFIIIGALDLPAIDLGFMSIPRMTSERYSSTVTILGGNFYENVYKNLSALFSVIFKQNDRLIWNAIPAFGTIYVFSSPFVILGTICIFKRAGALKKKFSPQAFVIFMMIASLILGIMSSVNINRANFIFIPLLIALGEGIAFTIRQLKKPAFIILPVYLCAFIVFTCTYFTSYQKQIGPAFFEGVGESITYASENTEKADTIYLSERINAPYVFALFYDKTDPQVFIDTVDYERTDVQFRRVNSFDRFVTGIPTEDEHQSGDAFVLHSSEIEPFKNSEIYDIKPFKYYYVAIKK